MKIFGLKWFLSSSLTLYLLLSLSSSEHFFINRTDNCDYNTNYKCGNVCLDMAQICDCGGEEIGGTFKFGHFFYCCVPPSIQCSIQWINRTLLVGKLNGENFKQQDYRVECTNVTLRGYNEPCNGKCYNDYLTSKYRGPDTHFTCPDSCIRWGEVCQGVSFCDGDEQICDKDLECFGRKKKIVRPNIEESYSCFDSDFSFSFSEIKNNGSYDRIDRSDEDINTIVVSTRLDINYTALKHCLVDEQDGFMCNNYCRKSSKWCYEERYAEHCLEAGVNVNDKILCSNETFWRNISCNTKFHNFEGTSLEFYHGRRCTGSIKHCYFPLGTSSHDPTMCLDKSDRVFNVGQPCPNAQDLNCWRECRTPGPNCTHPAGFQCPGSSNNLCWESCNIPGQNCLACTNQTYFICLESNQCVHPSLRCDGHPQCDQGEDERQCRDQYFQNNVISRYATLRCKSIMYPNIETFATPCDGFPECFDGLDEKQCTKDLFNNIFIASVLFIALLYLSISFGCKLIKIKSKDNLDRFLLIPHENTDIERSLIESYSFHHGNDWVIEELNTFLLHIIFTKNSDEQMTLFKELYASESNMHNQNEAEIFACLHKTLNPIIMERVIDCQFPGLKQRSIEKIETLCGKRWITFLGDYLYRNEKIMYVAKIFSSLVKIELEFIDILKDSFLAITLFLIVGYQTFIDFPSDFSVVVVLCLLFSVVIPIFFATLHLVLHNPFMIFQSDKIYTGYKRKLMILTCFILSVLNPIFLIREALKKCKISCSLIPPCCIKIQFLTLKSVRTPIILQQEKIFSARRTDEETTIGNSRAPI